ncbi:MAG: DUF4199 domain-containing protein [Erythrobacter sp.]|nr:DUF4199 domain-containing protein [Erythrobacter sp.]
MTRAILIYGVITGLVLEGVFLGSMLLGTHEGENGVLVGYLTMFIAMSIVFVGVKRFRDVERGGVIRFLPAWGLGTAIALVASLFYVLGWEVYMALSGADFIGDYMAGHIESLRAAGASAAELAAAQAEADELIANYANPLYRMPLTFMEIAPVVVIVPLVSAVLLRNPRFLPAEARA